MLILRRRGPRTHSALVLSTKVNPRGTAERKVEGELEKVFSNGGICGSFLESLGGLGSVTASFEDRRIKIGREMLFCSHFSSALALVCQCASSIELAIPKFPLVLTRPGRATQSRHLDLCCR